MRVKDAVGRFGEGLAVKHLAAAGLVVLDRNWRCADGELDIVARDGAVLVFVEVKTRSTVRCGYPTEAVTVAKARRIRRLAMQWLAERRMAGDPVVAAHPELRFDVVAVVRLAEDGPSIRHYRAAF